MSAISAADPVIHSPRWPLLAVAVMATGAIVGPILAATQPGSDWLWLHWVCKPLATLLILWLAWSTITPVSTRYRRWICAGIACSLLGDVLLMLPQNLFVPGLLAFLSGHLCFLTGLLGDSRLAQRPLWMLLSFAFGAINLFLLWPSIGVALRLPVIAYMLVLTGMGGQAMVRAQVLAQRAHAPWRSARIAAIGAVLFMASDGLLAWNRFHAPIPLSSLWVLSTYYLALWYIARSVRRDDGSETTDMIGAGAAQ
jgi:uncharacterized membrane protein YhhN